ncbi:transposase [Streptomyces sp. NPDC005732]|uniref:transposase n=1 Tax=Streptomyces sp. NPDC005732 TaxID=3157057 RepID=UPI0033CF46CF
MANDLVLDDLRDRIAPLLPFCPPRRRYPGRLPVEDRAAMRGIVHVPGKRVTWADVPAEQIGCSGVTVWPRLREWSGAGATACCAPGRQRSPHGLLCPGR